MFKHEPHLPCCMALQMRLFVSSNPFETSLKVIIYTTYQSNQINNGPGNALPIHRAIEILKNSVLVVDGIRMRRGKDQPKKKRVRDT